MEQPPSLTPFWIGEDSTGTKVEESEAQEGYDVLILGAGISGVSTAYWLRKNGFEGSIGLVDERGVALSATGRNAGLAWPASHREYDQKAIEVLKATADDLGVPCFLNGAVELYRTKEDFEALSKSSLGQVWDQDAVLRELPQLGRDAFYKGVFEPNVAHVSSFELTRALFLATPNVSFVRATAESVAEQIVTLKGGQEISANHIVVCTNASAGALIPSLPIQCVRGQCLHLKAVGDNVVFPKMGYAADDSYEYAMPWDGGLIFGGARLNCEEWDQENDCELNLDISKRLRRRLRQTLKLKPEDYIVTHEWTGRMGFTPDEYPIMGLVRPGLFVSAGFSGNGVYFGFFGAHNIAAAICGTAEILPIPDMWQPGREMVPLSWPDCSATEGSSYEGDEDEEEEEEDDDEEDNVGGNIGDIEMMTVVANPAK